MQLEAMFLQSTNHLSYRILTLLSKKQLKVHTVFAMSHPQNIHSSIYIQIYHFPNTFHLFDDWIVITICCDAHLEVL
jgi:hypothetical protein